MDGSSRASLRRDRMEELSSPAVARVITKVVSGPCREGRVTVVTNPCPSKGNPALKRVKTGDPLGFWCVLNQAVRIVTHPL